MKMLDCPSNAGEAQRLRIMLRGAVQGVGFRPFVFRLATELGLAGWVNNSPQGVLIEVEGEAEKLQSFLLRLEIEKPPRASIQSLESSYLDSLGYENFEIRPSDEMGEKTSLVLPDISTCPDCLQELFDPHNRRYRYPFTNCVHCGPRFSIIEALPYDRANTTMKKFTMCDVCKWEYHDPSDRRFHAQPTACPQCGPQLASWDQDSRVLAEREEALLHAASAIRAGKIVALKGIGGFQLLVDARNPEAVRRLRNRKHREEKPFAMMYPSLEAVRADCIVSALEERLLVSSEAPIVLLRRRAGRPTSEDPVAPNNPCLGIMLPYSPLHHLLMAELKVPVVATSGNLTDEPMATDEQEGCVRLRGIADEWLVHDRPIARPVDDSVVRVLMDRELVLRRARGYAPLPITLREAAPPFLAVGAHLKNTIAQSVGRSVFVSQHIGDLETVPAFEAFKRVVSDFEKLYDSVPEAVVCDLHPDYLSTQYAGRRSGPIIKVQHHYAHALSCMAENDLEAPVLAVSWDGTGYGLDGTLWGGEFLKITADRFERFAHLRTFPLPGGELAIKEPRRAALGLLYEIFGDELFSMEGLLPLAEFPSGERAVLKTILREKLNAPVTSSVGRLFDVVASLTGLRQHTHFEGQSAMELEFASESCMTDESYPFQASSPVINWEPMVRELIRDVRQEVRTGRIAAQFHNTLTEIIVETAREAGLEKVVLTGGCFQNRYLTERTVGRLRQENFHPYWHQRIPPNDGGIALGQVMAAIRVHRGELASCA